MIYKRFDQIEIDDIFQLKSNGIPEGKTIEYKLSIPGRKDQDKKEFLADISSFANTMGGDMIYGIQEENGIPKQILGINVADVDSEILRLESLIRDGIEPRISSDIKYFSLNNKEKIILIRVRRSWNGPHRVIFKGHEKFYARNSAGKYSLDTSELREAFTLSHIIGEKVRRFRNERIQSLLFNETSISYEQSAKIVLHLIPIDAFGKSVSYQMNSDKIINELKPMNTKGWNSRINFEGIMTYAGGTTPSSEYTQLYRNGIIEAVNTSILSYDSQIPDIKYQAAIIESLNNYLSVLRSLEVTVPLLCFLSLVNIKDYKITTPKGFFGDTYPIDKENLLLPEIVIESYEIIPKEILKPSFDLIYNACGISMPFN